MLVPMILIVKYRIICQHSRFCFHLVKSQLFKKIANPLSQLLESKTHCLLALTCNDADPTQPHTNAFLNGRRLLFTHVATRGSQLYLHGRLTQVPYGNGAMNTHTCTQKSWKRQIRCPNSTESGPSLNRRVRGVHFTLQEREYVAAVHAGR